MTGAAPGHRPENLVLAAVLTTAAFFCVALVGALAKVSGQYTSTGVLLLFQNVICLVFVTPVVLGMALVIGGGLVAVRAGPAAQDGPIDAERQRRLRRADNRYP